MEAKNNKAIDPAVLYSSEVLRLVDCAASGDSPVAIAMAIVRAGKEYHAASHSALVAACENCAGDLDSLWKFLEHELSMMPTSTEDRAVQYFASQVAVRLNQTRSALRSALPSPRVSKGSEG